MRPPTGQLISWALIVVLVLFVATMPATAGDAVRDMAENIGRFFTLLVGGTE